jgi:hypothetical protein
MIHRRHLALRECRVTFRDVRDIDHSVTVHAETTMDAAALGLKRIREQQFVLEDLADPITVELVTSTQHKVSLKKVIDWMARPGGVEPERDRDEGASAGGVIPSAADLTARLGFPFSFRSPRRSSSNGPRESS